MVVLAMSYGNYRYDENDRKLEQTLKRLPENFDDFMKGHKQEMNSIQP
jgi:hypothetical protein